MGELGHPERGHRPLMTRDFGRNVDRHELQIETGLSHAAKVQVKRLRAVPGDEIRARKSDPPKSVGVTVAIEVVLEKFSGFHGPLF